MVHTNLTDDVKVPKLKHQFIAEIEFGMPSKECRNFGICRITPIRFAAIPNLTGTLCIVSQTIDNKIEFTFLKGFVDPGKYKKFLAKNFFLVEEAYQYKSTGKDKINFKIPKGMHPIYEQISTITVKFKMKG